MSVFGVFDGHGPDGHLISHFVQNDVVRRFVKDPSFNTDPTSALSAAFRGTQAECDKRHGKSFDTSFSGSTGTIVMQKGEFLHVAHVGDSRAVLCQEVNGEMEATPLTEDHRPERKDERKRVHEAGGQVKRLEGDVLHRIFVKGKWVPGLAISRSFGDTVGRGAGVTAEPETCKRLIHHTFRFLLICSAGVWEFIENQEAVEIIASKGPSGVQEAVEELVYEALRRWMAEEGSVIDDITAVAAWLRPPVRGPATAHRQEVTVPDVYEFIGDEGRAK